MLSQKNKKNSFIFEEEFDHSQNNRNKKRALVKNQENLVDSLDGIKAFKSKFGSNDLEGKVIVKVDKEEFILEGESYLLIRPLMPEIESIYDNKNKMYVLPKWIEKKDFELFLNFLLLTSQGQVQKFDQLTCKRLIDISVFFKSMNSVKNLVNDCILPNLEKQTCLKLIKDYIDFLYDEETRNPFVSLVQKCMEIAAKNIFYLINNQSDQLFQISKESLEEIIERYFESVMFNVNIDHSLIIRLMIKSRRLQDIYDLLENERKRSITTFEKLHEEGMEPTIIWKIDSSNPNEGFYKESEPFFFENVSLILINYYDAEKDLYSMALKITEIKDCNNNPIDTETMQSIVSILSICEINEINFKSKINFNCIFTNTKTKILVSKIENFSKYFIDAGLKFEDIKYSLVIYFSISYNFSSILTHICKNFYEYYSLNSISKISRNVLNIILKNESLNVRNEDEVLYAVMNWVNNKQNVKSDTILDIIKNVNWSVISLDGLLDFIISQSKILIKSPALQSVVIAEFSRRFREEYSRKNTENNDENLNSSDIVTNHSGNNNPQSMSPRKKSSSRGGPPSSNAGNTNSGNTITHTTHTNTNFMKMTSKGSPEPSFTSELITKLINIASKYETPYNKSSTQDNVNQNVINPNISSRYTFYHEEDSKRHSLFGVINTSPDVSYSGLKPQQGFVNPPSDLEGNLKQSCSIRINNSNLLSSNIRKASINSNQSNSKKTTSTFSNIMENNPLKKKFFKNNMLAYSKDEKLSTGNLSKLSDIPNSTSVNRNKTGSNRSVTRERDTSCSNLLTNKSKSISNNDRSENTISAEKINHIVSDIGSSLSKPNKSLTGNKARSNNNSLISKIKFSPIYSFSNTNLNTNTNIINPDTVISNMSNVTNNLTKNSLSKNSSGNINVSSTHRNILNKVKKNQQNYFSINNINSNSSLDFMNRAKEYDSNNIISNNSNNFGNIKISSINIVANHNHNHNHNNLNSLISEKPIDGLSKSTSKETTSARFVKKETTNRPKSVSNIRNPNTSSTGNLFSSKK